jgi:sirohydrochlorin cobaltochelatase
MKTVIVLAMHGAPPHDFPKQEMLEFFGLHFRLEHAAPGAERAALERHHDELHARMRQWPRTAQNDPFYAASQDLAASLSRVAGYQVVVGFNEFCAPGLDEALDEAVTQGAKRVIVITPMMTPGGEHAQEDIPAAIRRAQKRHPGMLMHYAWPFGVAEVARFLAAQIDRFVGD